MAFDNGINAKGEFVVAVPDRFHQFLLMEIGRARGLDVRIKPGSKKKVYICGHQEDVESLLQATPPAGALLHLRQIEAVAEAVESIGESPSETLSKFVNLARLLYASLREIENGPILPRFTHRSLYDLN